MAIARLFTNLLCDDLAASRRFYVELLGFEVGFDSDWFVQLSAPSNPSLQLGLIAKGHAVAPEAARGAARGFYLTVVVDDVEAVRRQAMAMGVKILQAPEATFYGQLRMLVADPGGAVVDVSAPIPSP